MSESTSAPSPNADMESTSAPGEHADMEELTYLEVTAEHSRLIDTIRYIEQLAGGTCKTATLMPGTIIVERFVINEDNKLVIQDDEFVTEAVCIKVIA
jgi:hypothetical protein